MIIPIVLGVLISYALEPTVKAVCDHVEDFIGIGELLGD